MIGLLEELTPVADEIIALFDFCVEPPTRFQEWLKRHKFSNLTTRYVDLDRPGLSVFLSYLRMRLEHEELNSYIRALHVDQDFQTVSVYLTTGEEFPYPLPDYLARTLATADAVQKLSGIELTASHYLYIVGSKLPKTVSEEVLRRRQAYYTSEAVVSRRKIYNRSSSNA